MEKPKLSYTFHNPNTAEETADYILKLFVDAGMSLLEMKIDEESKSTSPDDAGQAR